MVETRAAEISTYQEGIVLIRIRDGARLEADEALEIVEATTGMVGREQHGNLVDARGMLYISREARQVLARQDRTSLCGVAILVASTLQRTMANLYLGVARPAVPTRMFGNEHEAVAWLRGLQQRA